MIEIRGTEQFACDGDLVRAGLGDLEQVAAALPGLTRIERNDGDTVVCRVRPGLAFLSGSLRTAITRREEAGPAALGYRIDSRGIGAGAVVNAHIRCLPDGGGRSRVEWQVRVEELSGLLKPVGASLIEAAMGRVAAATWEGLHARLDA
ncbi:MAG: SRPBCC domain-containing protein [Spirochaetaceae bacterium]|nr:SRPBCC domain-containing protein [Spirochaetaceae bacterium]